MRGSPSLPLSNTSTLVTLTSADCEVVALRWGPHAGTGKGDGGDELGRRTQRCGGRGGQVVNASVRAVVRRHSGR
eukprot:1373985-Prymnesium_polylepis.1